MIVNKPTTDATIRTKNRSFMLLRMRRHAMKVGFITKTSHSTMIFIARYPARTEDRRTVLPGLSRKSTAS